MNDETNLQKQYTKANLERAISATPRGLRRQMTKNKSPMAARKSYDSDNKSSNEFSGQSKMITSRFGDSSEE